MTQDEVRRLALALPEAVEAPHFDRASFRVRGKIFATLPPSGDSVVLMLPIEIQEAVIQAHPSKIRPLAPMATLEAAQAFFELHEGASDGNYNAYNYMVLTAHSKPAAVEKIPSVVHADGTGRIQIVRADDDPLTYAYLKALGRRIGVEVSVNTSFNVAGPIAQTPEHAVETLRRSKGLDAVFMVADDGTVRAAWHGGERDSGRFTGWLAAWRSVTAGARP